MGKDQRNIGENLMGTIRLINVIDEDFVNYRVPSMTLMFPYCTFKCGKENCQNYGIEKTKILEVSVKKICERYKKNLITDAIVCQGLEPIDSFDELYDFINTLRNEYRIDDNVVIYTGYNKDEIKDQVEKLIVFPNIIMKFGRFVPNQEHHYDEILGVELASPNQYAEYIS